MKDKTLEYILKAIDSYGMNNKGINILILKSIIVEAYADAYAANDAAYAAAAATVTYAAETKIKINI